MSKLVILLFLLGASIQSAKSQVLISLLLGDKLNSPNLEFGLEGGLSWSNIKGGEEFSLARDFHLGFYFDFRLKNEWYLHTGVRVKSSAGAEGVPVYPTGDAGIDSVFVNGKIYRKLNYFYVPATIKHRFKNNIYLEGGIQTGLLYKATDNFIESVYDDEDTGFRLDVRDEYNRIDFGLAAGVGYKIMKNTGMSIGVFYYHGIVDMYKDSRTGYNRSWYLYIFIPIGRGKAAEKASAGADGND